MNIKKSHMNLDQDTINRMKLNVYEEIELYLPDEVRMSLNNIFNSLDKLRDDGIDIEITVD